ncbi:hypothetical protein LXL04_006142 [Taraxacum kok-saghyz]
MVRAEENNSPCEYPSRNTPTTTGITRRIHRYPVDDEGGGGPGDPDVGCSGQSCRSCTAGAIADCIAVCCCPCAVVNFFTLTFLKLPWMMGRKCLGLSKNKKKKKLKNDEKEKDRSGVLRKVEGLESKVESLRGFEDDDKDEHNSGRFETEVWLELYKVDHLGFGRVSFTGINQSIE